MTTSNQQSFLIESQKWMALALLLLAGWILYLLAPVLSPFVMGAILAYLGDPLVDRLEKRKIPRTLGVTIVFILFSGIAVLAIVMLVPLIQKQLVIMYQSIPGFLLWINETALPWLEKQTGFSVEALEPGIIIDKLQEHLQSAGSIAASILSGVGSSSMALALWLTNVVLIPVVAFYLMRDWDHMVNNIQAMLPRKKVAMVTQLASEMDDVLGAFLRGQLLVMLALGVIYSVGLWMIGLNVALIIGMIAGLASIVPYLGFIVGIVAAIIAAVVQFGDFSVLLYVVIVFGVGQMLESMLLTPLLVGDKIGLHPVAVIFAIMAGGQLFGFVGILVALPVAAVIMVLLRYMFQQYKLSAAYSTDGQLSEDSSNIQQSLDKSDVVNEADAETSIEAAQLKTKQTEGSETATENELGPELGQESDIGSEADESQGAANKSNPYNTKID
jgi:predicted PurR-regulated permease PerM